jgi:hypothetical protein
VLFAPISHRLCHCLLFGEPGSAIVTGLWTVKPVLRQRSSLATFTSSSNLRFTLANVVPERPSLPVVGPSLLSRAHSQKAFTPGLAIDKISEVDGTDDGVYADPAPGSETDWGVEKPHARSQIPPTRQRVNALTRSATRPRRSASLSDASRTSPGRLRLNRSPTVVTGIRASRRAASDERGLALWCAPRDKYGSDQPLVQERRV